MGKPLRNRVLALGGIAQAIHLVQQLAHHGTAAPDILEVCVKSLFNINPENTESVFGGAQHVKPGLELVPLLLGADSKKRDLELARYIIGIMALERQLDKRKTMLDQLSEGIERARNQLDYFSYTHSNVIANLADLYTETISTLIPRIIVNGEQGYLTNPEISNKIRTLLLAGIRSAILWRQCGGSRIQLLFSRDKIVREARRIIDEELAL